jgi:hypothetical protein
MIQKVSCQGNYAAAKYNAYSVVMSLFMYACTTLLPEDKANYVGE